MDALSDVLRVIHLTGAVFLRAEFTAPWSVLAGSDSGDCADYCRMPSTSSTIISLPKVAASPRYRGWRPSGWKPVTWSCFREEMHM